MSARYYRLLPAFAATLSVLLPGLLPGLLSVLLAGCGSDPPVASAAAPQPAAAQPAPAQVAASEPDDIDTEATIWTVLGMSKRPSERAIGPQTGDKVSPLLWEAAHDTLNFVKVASEDPMTGVLQTDWYSPPGKPNERMRVSVFILSRALRSDALSVTIDRQQRSPTGQWSDASIAKDAVAELETAVLLRARHIRAERYRNTS
jgi:hypothetical protein